MKRQKACGEDEIYNEYLINLNKIIWLYLLNLMNLIKKGGFFLRSFQNSIIVPMHKEEGKSVKESNNYRYLALTSCLCKLIE